MNSRKFLNELKKYSSPNVFNPYVDICSFYDKKNASSIRSKNLLSVLNSFGDSGVDSIWIGRDLGHRGGRRTGLALTDEAHLSSGYKFWGADLQQATKGKLFAERTARNIWDILSRVDEKIFLWNVFPFHPHNEDEELSNRSHTAKERYEGEEFLDTLISLLRPKKLVAIGNDAFKSAEKISQNQDVYKIRHPSYGGEKVFNQQICKLYELSPVANSHQIDFNLTITT